MDNLKNAADEETVSKSAEKEKNNVRREIDDLRFLLKHQQFKRFIWSVLSYTGVYESPFNLNAALTNLNIGRGEVGRFLMAKINDADARALVTMKEEAINVRS